MNSFIIHPLLDLKSKESQSLRSLKPVATFNYLYQVCGTVKLREMNCAQPACTIYGDVDITLNLKKGNDIYTCVVNVY